MMKKIIVGSLVIIGVLMGIFSFTKKEVITLKKGDKVPHFVLKDQDGNAFDIKQVIGKKNLVIYFYPKDDTPGCTKEACKFRDEFQDFTDLNARVIGISADSPESHKAFIQKYNLPFTLLSDTENTVRQAFGVKGNFMGIIPGRVTFIVDKTGTIQYVFESLSGAEQHVTEAKTILQNL